MDFIDPKIDFAFKKIFGDEQHKDILISFLNAILYASDPVIKDLEILNPYLAPKLSGLKDTFLDVRAKLGNNQYVIIEMQVLAVEGFAKRILYNVTKAYSAQLKPKANYESLSPVIGLTITSFKMFEKTNDVLSRFILYDKEHKTDYVNKDIELVFVELPKFKKQLSQLQTITDKWLYFMKYADILNDVPQAMQADAAIERAFQIANRVNLTQEELDELETREFFVQDMYKIVKHAERRAEEQYKQGVERGIKEGVERGIKEGVERGIKEGVERGIKEGVERGIKEGVEQGIEQVAIALLDLLDDDTISQKTGLSLEQIKQLRRTNDTEK